jgi:hypothetical protein
MADTSGLRPALDWVRGELAREAGTSVAKQTVSLTTGGEHTFNAVSADGQLVAQIITSSGATSSGKRPVGKIQAALSHLYFLALTQAPERRLVVTDPEFYDFVDNATEGALAHGLKLQLLELPAEIQSQVRSVTQVASKEMG